MSGADRRTRERERHSSNYTIFHYKTPTGTPYGLYKWRRPNTIGYVLRTGSRGHVQIQFYKRRLVGPAREERRRAHGVMVSWWGIRGRRRKKAIEMRVHW